MFPTQKLLAFEEVYPDLNTRRTQIYYLFPWFHQIASQDSQGQRMQNHPNTEEGAYLFFWFQGGITVPTGQKVQNHRFQRVALMAGAPEPV